MTKYILEDCKVDLKKAWKALIKKAPEDKPEAVDTVAGQASETDIFPIVEMSKLRLQSYQRIPLAGI